MVQLLGGGVKKRRIVLPNIKQIIRFPKKELVTEMTKILDVNPWTLYSAITMNATEFMDLLFWIDEFNPSAIRLFQLETCPG